jgi:hypothetical protein
MSKNNNKKTIYSKSVFDNFSNFLNEFTFEFTDINGIDYFGIIN